MSLGIGDTPLGITIDYKFNGLNIQCTSESTNVPGVEGKHIGAYFEGTKETLMCDYGSRELIIDGEKLTDMAPFQRAFHVLLVTKKNFIDSVKGRIQPESNLAYARQMTLPMH